MSKRKIITDIIKGCAIKPLANSISGAKASMFKEYKSTKYLDVLKI